MSKINFTQAHLEELKQLIAEAVLNGIVIKTNFGQTFDVCQLEGLSLNTLRSISASIIKKKSDLTIDDQWTENPNEEKIKELDWQLRLITLFIGYKLKKAENEEITMEKERLTKQLNDLVESQKTPEDLIKELREKLDKLS